MAMYAQKNIEIYKRDIERVTTVTGASEIACVSPRTIYYQLIEGNIHAELVNSIWLVSVQSVKDYYNIKD